MTQPEAVAPDQWGEWIEWSGGTCPIANDVCVQRKYRDGIIGAYTTNVVVGGGGWAWSPIWPTEDIVAYRVAAQAASVSPGIGAADEPKDHHPGRGEGEPCAWRWLPTIKGKKEPWMVGDATPWVYHTGAARPDFSACRAGDIIDLQPLYAHPPTSYGKGEREAVAACIWGGSTFTHEDRLDMADAILAALQSVEREELIDGDIVIRRRHGKWMADVTGSTTHSGGWSDPVDAVRSVKKSLQSGKDKPND